MCEGFLKLFNCKDTRMLISFESFTEDIISKISVGDTINYTSGAPMMCGKKIKSVLVKKINETQIIFDDGLGILKRNLLRKNNCLQIVSIDFKNFN